MTYTGCARCHELERDLCHARESVTNLTLNNGDLVAANHKLKNEIRKLQEAMADDRRFRAACAAMTGILAHGLNWAVNADISADEYTRDLNRAKAQAVTDAFVYANLMLAAQPKELI